MRREIKMLDGSVKYFKELKNGNLEEVKANAERFVPKENEKLYYVTAYGRTVCSHRKCFNDNEIEYLLKTGNCFATKEEAERKAEIKKFIINKAKRFTCDDWYDKHTEKYSIYAQFSAQELGISYRETTNSSNYQFETAKDVQDVIDFVGFADWCKYVLNVYED